jgi:hypothetical protein
MTAKIKAKIRPAGRSKSKAKAKTKVFALWLSAGLCVVLLFSFLYVAAEARTSETVRVAVAKAGKTMEFTTDVAFQIVEQARGGVVAQTAKNERWRVEIRDNRLYLHGAGRTYGPYNGPVDRKSVV